MKPSDWMPDFTHPWTRFALIIVIALAVAGLLRRMVKFLLRRFAVSHPMGASIIARANAPMEAVVPLAMLLIAFRASPDEPARLIDGNGHLELFEGWLFNDNGQFQLRSAHSPQAGRCA